MRWAFILPKVEPEHIPPPKVCPQPGGHGKPLKRFQEVTKRLRDTHFSEVQAHRDRCLRPGYPFRVDPAGVSRDHFSQRVKGLAVVLYLLGLSYGAVSLLLEALGLLMSQTLIDRTVQEAARRVPGMRRQPVLEGIRTPAIGRDVPSGKGKGKWVPIGGVVDEKTGRGLTIDGLEGEEAKTLKEWLQPVVETVGAEILVTDDAEAGQAPARRGDPPGRPYGPRRMRTVRGAPSGCPRSRRWRMGIGGSNGFRSGGRRAEVGERFKSEAPTGGGRRPASPIGFGDYGWIGGIWGRGSRRTGRGRGRRGSGSTGPTMRRSGRWGVGRCGGISGRSPRSMGVGFWLGVGIPWGEGERIGHRCWDKGWTDPQG